MKKGIVSLSNNIETLDLALDDVIAGAHKKGIPYTQILKMFLDKQATLIPLVITESHMK